MDRRAAHRQRTAGRHGIRRRARRAPAVQRRHAVVGRAARVEQPRGQAASSRGPAAGARTGRLRRRRPRLPPDAGSRTTSRTWCSATCHIHMEHAAEVERVPPRAGSGYGAVARHLPRRRRGLFAGNVRLRAGPGDRGPAEHHGVRWHAADAVARQPRASRRRRRPQAARCGLTGKARRMSTPTTSAPPMPFSTTMPKARACALKRPCRPLQKAARCGPMATSLRIEGARAVTLFIAAATGYRGYDRDPDGCRRRNRRRVPKPSRCGAAANPTKPCARRMSPTTRSCSGASR